MRGPVVHFTDRGGRAVSHTAVPEAVAGSDLRQDLRRKQPMDRPYGACHAEPTTRLLGPIVNQECCDAVGIRHLRDQSGGGEHADLANQRLVCCSG